MRNAAAVLVVTLATGVIAMVAVAHPAAGTAPMPAQPATAPITTPVGPGGPAPAEPATAPASPTTSASEGSSASQVITGVVGSTSAVQVTPGAQPDYQGSEPAYMTVSRTGSQETVTVVPR